MLDKEQALDQGIHEIPSCPSESGSISITDHQRQPIRRELPRFCGRRLREGRCWVRQDWRQACSPSTPSPKTLLIHPKEIEAHHVLEAWKKKTNGSDSRPPDKP
jgi:hypothetical protein